MHIMDNWTTTEGDFYTLLPSPTPVVVRPGQHLFVGCGLAIGGNLLISISLNIQKYTHNKNEEDPNSKHYLHHPLWWLGIILMGLGELGNFSAYGFAPASLVAPLGTTTVVANLFIAIIFLKELLRPEDLFGCVLAVIGAFLLVNFSQKNEVILGADEILDNLTQTTFIIYCILEVITIGILMVLKYKFGVNSVLVLILITALLASFTVIGAKAVSGMIQLTIGGNMQLTRGMFYAMLILMVITCAAQIKYLNQAMMAYDSTVVVPTNFVFFTISAIVAGIIFYKEFWGMKAIDVIMFLFGCLLCFAGVYFITAGRSTLETQEGEQRPIMKRFLDVICPAWLFMKVNTANLSTDTIPIVNNTAEDVSYGTKGKANEGLDSEGANGKTYGTTEPP